MQKSIDFRFQKLSHENTRSVTQMEKGQISNLVYDISPMLFKLDISLVKIFNPRNSNTLLVTWFTATMDTLAHLTLYVPLCSLQRRENASASRLSFDIHFEYLYVR